MFPVNRRQLQELYRLLAGLKKLPDADLTDYPVEFILDEDSEGYHHDIPLNIIDVKLEDGVIKVAMISM